MLQCHNYRLESMLQNRSCNSSILNYNKPARIPLSDTKLNIQWDFLPKVRLLNEVYTRSEMCTRTIHTCTSGGQTHTAFYLMPFCPAVLCHPCLCFHLCSVAVMTVMVEMCPTRSRKPLPSCLGNPINLSERHLTFQTH